MKTKFLLNRVIWLLTFSDITTWGLYSAVSNLIGLYFADKFGANVVETIGIGIAIYTITRAIFQIPIGIISDGHKNDKDEILFLSIGMILMGIPFLIYPSIQTTTAYFVTQSIFGIGSALNLVNWRKLFAKNVDDDNEGTAYAVYDTTISVCVGLISLTISYIAGMGKSQFDFVMYTIGFIMISGSIFAMSILRIKNRKSLRIK